MRVRAAKVLCGPQRVGEAIIAERGALAKRCAELEEELHHLKVDDGRHFAEAGADRDRLRAKLDAAVEALEKISGYEIATGELENEAYDTARAALAKVRAP